MTIVRAVYEFRWFVQKGKFRNHVSDANTMILLTNGSRQCAATVTAPAAS